MSIAEIHFPSQFWDYELQVAFLERLSKSEAWEKVHEQRGILAGASCKYGSQGLEGPQHAAQGSCHGAASGVH